MSTVGSLINSQKLPCTARLLSVADPLFDPTVPLIKKIATAIFSALAISVGILFTLAADGVYYLFPNLATAANGAGNVSPPGQRQPTPPPAARRADGTQPATPSADSSWMGWRTIGKVALAASAFGLLGAGAYGLYSYLTAAAPLVGPAVSSALVPVAIGAATTVANTTATAATSLATAASELVPGAIGAATTVANTTATAATSLATAASEIVPAALTPFVRIPSAFNTTIPGQLLQNPVAAGFPENGFVPPPIDPVEIPQLAANQVPEDLVALPAAPVVNAEAPIGWSWSSIGGLALAATGGLAYIARRAWNSGQQPPQGNPVPPPAPPENVQAAAPPPANIELPAPHQNVGAPDPLENVENGLPLPRPQNIFPPILPEPQNLPDNPEQNVAPPGSENQQIVSASPPLLGNLIAQPQNRSNEQFSLIVNGAPLSLSGEQIGAILENIQSNVIPQFLRLLPEERRNFQVDYQIMTRAGLKTITLSPNSLPLLSRQISRQIEASPPLVFGPRQLQIEAAPPPVLRAQRPEVAPPPPFQPSLERSFLSMPRTLEILHRQKELKQFEAHQWKLFLKQAPWTALREEQFNKFLLKQRMEQQIGAPLSVFPPYYLGGARFPSAENPLSSPAKSSQATLRLEGKQLNRAEIPEALRLSLAIPPPVASSAEVPNHLDSGEPLLSSSVSSLSSSGENPLGDSFEKLEHSDANPSKLPGFFGRVWRKLIAAGDAKEKDEPKGLKYLFALNGVRDELTLRSPNAKKTATILENLESYLSKRPKKGLVVNLFDKAVQVVAGYQPDPYECAESIRLALNALNTCERLDVKIREPYENFLLHSREAFLIAKILPEIPDKLQEALNYLKLAHHLRYTSVSMYPFYSDFLRQALEASFDPQSEERYAMPERFTLGNIAKEIGKANKALSRKCLSHVSYFLQDYIPMQWKKLQGTLGLYFDPTRDSNTPWVHSVQQVIDKNGTAKTITIGRHGTPTQDPGVFGAIGREIANISRAAVSWIPAVGRSVQNGIPAPRMSVVVPEYEAFLEADPSFNTLYINHQEFYPVQEELELEEREKLIEQEGPHPELQPSLGRVSAEIDRSRTIQELERHPNFNFAAFPLDGEIWEKEWLEKVPINDLKNTLFDSVINGKNGFAIPQRINAKSPKFQSALKNILERVHKLYFGEKEPETFSEKAVFNLIFYSYLKNYFKSELNIDLILSICKDDKDRGNASKVVDMIITMMLLGQENDSSCLEELFFSAIAPFIIKNEKIIEDRLKIALWVIEHISKLTEDQKVAIRNEFRGMTGLTIVSQSVPKRVPSLGLEMGMETDPKKQSEEEELLRKKFSQAQRDQEVRSDPNARPNFQLPQLVHFMRKNGIVKTSGNLNAVKQLISDIRTKKVWNLVKLREQIEKDLTRQTLRLSGKEVFDFKKLTKEVGLDTLDFKRSIEESSLNPSQLAALSFLSILHQGSSGNAIIEAFTYLSGNDLGLLMTQKTMPQGKHREATVIEADYDRETGAYQVRVKTQQELSSEQKGVRDPNGKFVSYPIEVTTEIERNSILPEILSQDQAVHAFVENPPPALLRWQFTDQAPVNRARLPISVSN